MTERVFRIEVPEGQHLGRVKGADDLRRGLLFDDDNNLVGHAEMSEVDDEYEDDSATYGQYPDDDVDLEALLKELEALVELAILVAAAVEAAAPHIKRWWKERGRSFVVSHRDKAKASFARMAKRLRRRSNTTPSGRAGLVETATAADPTDLVKSYHEFRLTMSSAEAKERFVAALLTKEFADAQMRILHSARIVDADESLTELERVVQSLTPGQVEAVIEQLLTENPALIQRDNLAELATALNSSQRALPASLNVPVVRASGIPIDPGQLKDPRAEL